MRLDELDQIPLKRRSFRFGIYDSKEYSIDGHALEKMLELTDEGAAGNRRFEIQLSKLGVKENSDDE